MLIWASDANFILINWLKPKGREKNILCTDSGSTQHLSHHSMTKHLFTVM